MKNFNYFFRVLGLTTFIVASSIGFFSCDDNTKIERNPNVTESAQDGFFLSLRNPDGTAEYITLVSDLSSGDILISDNLQELESYGYTWIFNSSPSAALGLIYNQGDPGVGLGYTINSDGTLNTEGKFQITSRFTSYGFCGDYALTSVGGVTLNEKHEDGTDRTDGATFNFINIKNGFSRTDKTIPTLGITGRSNEQTTFSGIVDLGDNTFLTGMVVSQAIDETATGGSSSGTVNYPDSVWVARLDMELNILDIYKDDRISYSSGRYRSQYYSHIGKTDDGTIYVFSGAYDANTTHEPGGLKLNSSLNGFDSDYVYYFGEGHRFKRIWYISDHYFMGEFYNDKGAPTSSTVPSTKYGIVNMKNKTFSWLTNGFPGENEITSTGLPMSYGGKLYFPVTTETEYPTVYIIDPATTSATKGIKVTYAGSIGAIGRLAK